MSNPEQEPVINLNLGSEVFPAKRDNTHLFTHMGALAMYDHIFLVRGENEGNMTGTYLFHNLQLNTETFTGLLHFMVEHGYHTDMNRTEVPQCDIDAYEANVAMWSSDVEEIGGVPEDWS